MYFLLAILGVLGLSALVDNGSGDGDSGGTDTEGDADVTTDDEPDVTPTDGPSPDASTTVDDIDVTSLVYDPAESEGLEDGPFLEGSVVILNDEIVSPSGETEDGTPIYDLSSFDAETDRVAILEPVSDFVDVSETTFDVAQMDDGSLMVSGVILQGIEELPRGVLEVHLVEEDFIVEGDTEFTLDENEIAASFEVVSARIGEAGDDVYRPGAGIELYALSDLEGATRLNIQGDTAVRVETGEEDDVVDLSADTHGGVAGLSRFDGADPEASFGFISTESTPGNTISEHDYSTVQTNGGEDSITMGGRETVVYAGEGNDTITASTNNSCYIEAGDGHDLIDLSALEATGLSMVQGGLGNDTFIGGAGSDTYFGGNHSGNTGGDDISGGAGDDSLFGSTGFDVIDGGDGNDTIGGMRDYVEYPPTAGSGFPSIDATDYADEASDTLNGGQGDDLLLGDALDVMTGGAGSDTFAVYWEANDDGANDRTFITDFEPGVDVLHVTVHVDDFGLPDDPDQEITLGVFEFEGNTLVMFQDEVVAEIQGIVGVSADDVTGNVFVPYNRL